VSSVYYGTHRNTIICRTAKVADLLQCPSIKELKTAFSFAEHTKQRPACSVLLLHSGIMPNTPPLDNVDLSSDEGYEPIQDGLPVDHLADVALPRHDS
jgi:hypothetical protein